jgi:hypothetical protein
MRITWKGVASPSGAGRMLRASTIEGTSRIGGGSSAAYKRATPTKRRAGPRTQNARSPLPNLCTDLSNIEQTQKQAWV